MFEYKVADFVKSNNPTFREACQSVPPPWGKPEGTGDKGIPATHRQASKWLRGKGIAYKVMRGIV